MLFFYPRFFRVTIKSLPQPPGARIDRKIREFKANINLIEIGSDPGARGKLESRWTQKNMTFERQLCIKVIPRIAT